MMTGKWQPLIPWMCKFNCFSFLNRHNQLLKANPISEPTSKSQSILSLNNNTCTATLNSMHCKDHIHGLIFSFSFNIPHHHSVSNLFKSQLPLLSSSTCSYYYLSLLPSFQTDHPQALSPHWHWEMESQSFILSCFLEQTQRCWDPQGGASRGYCPSWSRCRCHCRRPASGWSGLLCYALISLSKFNLYDDPDNGSTLFEIICAQLTESL